MKYIIIMGFFKDPLTIPYVQNICPAFLVEDIVLEMFSVNLLGLLDLLRTHNLPCRGESRKELERRHWNAAILLLSLLYKDISCSNTHTRSRNNLIMNSNL